MRALRKISTRATITPTRFHNFYNWGGLKADPHDLVRRYYDLFVYRELSSGTRWATLRFPSDRIDRPSLAYVRDGATHQRLDECSDAADRWSRGRRVRAATTGAARETARLARS